MTCWGYHRKFNGRILRRASVLGPQGDARGVVHCALAPDLVKQSVGRGILVRSLRHFGRQVPIGALDTVEQQLAKRV